MGNEGFLRSPAIRVRVSIGIRMKGYKLEHKDFMFRTSFSESILHYKDKPYIICKVSTNSLYARIVSGYSGARVKHRIVKIGNTPHYAFLKGNERKYRQYLEKYGRDVGYTLEHSVESFKELINSKERYLESKYKSNFIVCESVNRFFSEKIVILDGVHRASLLLYQGVSHIPVVLITEGHESQFLQYLTDYRDDFIEWYTPIQFNDVIIHERTYPDFEEHPEFLTNKERGKSKWDFIIEKNLPDIRGKTICDIGCNVGLYSNYLLQLGAARVDGYDRGADIVQPTNPNLPRQNVVNQAYFVKNLFKLSGLMNNEWVNFFECDIATLDFSKMKYDMLFSCCVLYHFKDKFEEIIKTTSSHIPELFLQTNIGHRGEDLSKYVSIEYHEKLLNKYGYNVRIDAPTGYNYPIIYGKKS